MFPSLKSALVVGALACITTASPVSQPPETTPAAYQGLGLPMPTYVTVTKQVTMVYKNVPVDCVHGPLPTPAPKPICDLDNLLQPITSIRQYCGGTIDLPPTKIDLNEGNEEDLDDDVEDGDDELDDGGRFEPRLIADCTAQVMEGPRISLYPTSTVYTTTSTVSRKMNCGPCTKVSPTPYYSPGVPPVANFTTTVTAIQPYTTTLLECDPYFMPDGESGEGNFGGVGGMNAIFPPIATLITKSDPWPPALTSYTAFPKGVTAASCAIVYNLFPSRLGSVRKIYTATHTTTAHKDCDGCALVWGTAPYPYHIGPLPTTVTKKGKTTVTAMACKTPGKGL